MRSYLRGIQATYLIEGDLPWLQNGNLSKKNWKLNGLWLVAIMTNWIANGLMDVVVGATTIKEIWTRLYD